MNKAQERTLSFVEDRMVKEHEKFKAGEKNNWYQWEDLFNKLEEEFRKDDN